MSRTGGPRNQQQMRELIAQTAARFLAEGASDFATAKRKAARQLGATDTHCLPTNEQIEAALRSYQQLYLGEQQQQHVDALRRVARSAMRQLEKYSPQLTGSVLSGTAGPYANINLHLFAEDSKEVELDLLNKGIAFEYGEKRFRSGERTLTVPTLTLQLENIPVECALFTPQQQRLALRSPVDGKMMERASLKQLELLLNGLA